MLHEYERRYGPYAFGVCSLLLVWVTIVGPALQAARVDATALKAITDDQATKLADITNTQRDIANAQRGTADVLNSATVRLDKISERLERTADRMNGG